MRTWALACVALGAGIGLGVACGSDETTAGGGGAGGDFPEQTGSECETAADCFPDLDGGTLEGEALCLDRVRDGYCTHTCTDDSDCCAVEGECQSDLLQVCSPFESAGGKMCFLSCEPEDLVQTDAGVLDEQAFCQAFASPDFICRSSGGGTENRKVCVPGDCGVGASCATEADCAANLDCVTSFDGGYCTVIDCSANADCPNDSRCVTLNDGHNYCLRTCNGTNACTFCRPYELGGDCTSDADFVEADTAVDVCLPP